MSQRKVLISIRIAPQVLGYFQSKAPSGYQTLMHQVLEQHVQQERDKQIRNEGRAQELFRQFHARCFWHYRRDLEINSDNMFLVAEGLRKYGGREGLRAAEELCQ
jgi:hypothetical protein